LTLFTVGWLLWFLYFAILEGVALFNSKPGDTLSEHVWTWFGTNFKRGENPRQPSGWTRARRFVLLAFMAWLTLHFLTGGIF
jgi:hypothetical protein